MILSRVGTTPVYAEPPGHDGPAFLLFRANSGDALPPSISANEAWSQPGLTGTFVVVPATPAGETALAALADAISADAAIPFPSHTSFAWTSFDGSTLAAAILLPLRAADGGAAVDGTLLLGIGGYGPVLPDGSPVTASLDDGGDVAAFGITYAPQPGFPPPRNSALTIPWSGASRFCLLGEGVIADPTADPATGFDISIHYFADADDGLTWFDYPIFAPFPPGVMLLTDLTLDPLTAWWTPDGPLPMRTAYALRDAGIILTQVDGTWTLSVWTPAPLRTNFRTLYGDGILLTPLDVSFVPEPLASAPGEWCLVPEGAFRIEPATPADGPLLLCGLSGTETIAFTAGDTLTFTPHQPAHAPAFPLVGRADRPPAAAGPLLTATIGAHTPALTAYLSIGPSTTYFAQPQASPLFASGPVENVLPLFTPPVASPGATPFPMAPYAAVTAGNAAADYVAFETQILAPARLAVLAAGPPPPFHFPDDAVRTTTPDGLLVTVDSGGTWSSLILGSSAPGDGSVQSLVIESVTRDLRNALLAPDVFLVVTQPAEPIAIDGTLSLAGWPVSIELTGDDGPIVVFNFSSSSLQEMAGASDAAAAWSNPAAFTGNVADVQARLKRIVNGAINAARVDPGSPFAPFAAIATDPSWTGILILDVPVALSALPPDLIGLAGGIEATGFRWQNVGISVSPVTADLAAGPSSIFGLIDYADRSARAGAHDDGDGGFSFRVLTLRVEVANSQIVTFQSTIVLTITTLFGESVQMLLPAGAVPILQNSITLEGHLETRVADDGTTAIVYVFSGNGVMLFTTPASAILNYVAVIQSEFSTVKPPSSTDRSVVSEFRLWGKLNFQVMPGLDIFSFGDTAGEVIDPGSPSGAAFANLAVAMTFSIDDPAGAVAFELDPTAVTFDITASGTPRSGSLFESLPLSLGSLISNRTATIDAYQPVIARALRAGGIDSGEWFAITNVIDLGTMGALASLASFNALLVALWTPGGPRPRAALMMQLPGTSAGISALSLQDVLRLDIGQIVIPAAPDGGPVQLQFNNIALQFLGIQLPPGVTLNMALTPGAPGQSMAWYASYVGAAR